LFVFRNFSIGILVILKKKVYTQSSTDENDPFRIREKVVQSEILSGWKDIANYLGKGVRTVQRYERELGLPVRRPSGKMKGSVIATQAELSSWVAASCRPPEPPHPLTAASVLPACDALRGRIAEMERLGQQMNKLRGEIRASREMLRESIHRMHGEVSREGSEHKRGIGLRPPGKWLA
jgi:hypothetical protein